MLMLNFTNQSRRPSVKQIISRWKEGGRPPCFTVEYGETFAEFQKLSSGRWDDSGNGCRGVDRNAVVKALAKESGDAGSTQSF